MERVYEFLPSVLILACVAGVTFLYLKLIIKQFGDNFKSVEWHKKNRWKVALAAGSPEQYIWAPAVEELIFRAPLIIAFSAVSSVAWYGIFASSVLFALAHWFGKKIGVLDILFAKESGNYQSDDMVAEMNQLHAKNEKMVAVRKVLHVAFALPMSILAGYYGIKYQSVWVAFGIHSLWNMFMPVVGIIIMLLGSLAFYGILSLWDRVRWRRRDSW